MKSILFLIMFLSFACFSYTQSLSPEVVASGGDYYDNGSVSLSTTIGECVIETCYGSTAILTQGFQQSKLTITQIEKLETEPFDCFVYPNPVQNELNIEIEGLGDENILFEIFNMNGKMILQQTINAENTTVSFSNYKAATYILKIHDNNGVLSNTYRIVKAD